MSEPRKSDNSTETYSLSSLLADASLTASTAAWLVAVVPKYRWLSPDERDYLITAANEAAKKPLPRASSEVRRGDTRDWTDPVIDYRNHEGFRPCIYTTYEYGKTVLSVVDECDIVTDMNDAHFILTHLSVSNFYELPQYLRVNQFPFEGGLVRKDLLILTVRGYCYDQGKPPIWWQPAFDLSTEFHYFAEYVNDVIARNYQISDENSKVCNNWILKPSIGTRAKGHYILLNPAFRRKCDSSTSDLITPDDDSRVMLLEAACVCPKLLLNTSVIASIGDDVSKTVKSPVDNMLLTKIDRVAQLLVDKPLCVRRLKFDIRVYVLVRSFVPFEAYVHKHHYGRLANKPYSESGLLDHEVFLTVNGYNDDCEIASRYQRILREDLKSELLQENPTLDYNAMMQTMIDMLRELFQGAAIGIGSWPASSAYYSVDVIFDTASCSRSPFIPQAKLVEVNFMGDMTSAKIASKSDEEFKDWATDLVLCLCTKKPLNSNTCIPLL